MTAKKISAILVLSLIASCALVWRFATVNSSAPNPKEQGLFYTESKTFEVEWNFELTNTSAKNQRGELHIAKIPEPDDHSCHGQEVLEQTFTPQPSQELTFPEDNACAVYAFDGIKPGKTVTITQRARVRLTSINSDIPDLHSGIVNNSSIPDQHNTQSFTPRAPQSALHPDQSATQFSDSRPNPSASASSASELDNSASAKLAHWSKTWAGDESCLWYRLVRLYDGVRGQRYELESTPRSLEQILSGSALQCQDAARFMIELARHEGCPSRQVTGIYLRPEYPHSTTLHAWSEVQLPTGMWVVIDPTMGRFPEERASRLAQLDNYYLTLWHGTETADICRWTGAPLPLKISFNHRLLSRQATTPKGLRSQPAFNGYISAWDKAGTPAVAPELTEVQRQKLQVAQNALSEQCYAQAEAILSTCDPSPERLALLSQLYSQTKQNALFWQTLTAKIAFGRERDDLVSALSWCVDSSDWDAVEMVTSRGLQLFPDDVDLLIARCHSLYRQGGDEAIAPLLERVQAICRDGYHEAMWGNLCLDGYRLDEARNHWERALKLGLRPEERSYYEKMLELIMNS